MTIYKPRLPIRLFAFLLVLVLLLTAYPPQPAQAVAITASMVAIFGLSLMMAGFTFSYATSDQFVSDMTGMINDFCNLRDMTVDALFSSDMLDKFSTTGEVYYNNPNVWNDFIGAVASGEVVAASAPESIIVNDLTVQHFVIDGVSLFVCPSGVTPRNVLDTKPTVYKKYTPYSTNVVTVFPSITDKLCYFYYSSKDVNVGVKDGPMSGHTILTGLSFFVYYDGTTRYLFIAGLDSSNTFDSGVRILLNYYLPEIASFIGAAHDDIVATPDNVISIPKNYIETHDSVLVAPVPDYWTGQDTYPDFLDQVVEGVGTGTIDVPTYDELLTDAGTGTENPPIASEWAGADIEDLKAPSLINAFPFCIPFDLIALVGALNARAEAPRFVIPIDLSFIGYEGEIVVDLSEWEDAAAVIRWGVTIGFILMLIILTRNTMIKG